MGQVLPFPSLARPPPPEPMEAWLLACLLWQAAPLLVANEYLRFWQSWRAP